MGTAASRTPGYVIDDSTMPVPLCLQTTKKKNVFWIILSSLFLCPRLLFKRPFFYHPATGSANEAEQGEIDDGCNQNQKSGTDNEGHCCTL